MTSSDLTTATFSVLEKSYPTPMHYKEITDVLIDSGTWSQLPKTPEQTICSKMTVDINLNGPDSFFQRIGEKGSGIYTVNPKFIETDESSSSSSSKIKGFGALLLLGPVVSLGLWVLNHFKVI